MSGFTPPGLIDGDYIPVVAASLLSQEDTNRSFAEARGRSSGQGAIVNWLFWAPSLNWPTATHELMAETIKQVKAGFDECLTQGPDAALDPKKAIDVAMDWAWLMDDDRKELFSFVNCCESLGLPTSTVRRKWIEQYAPSLPAVRNCMIKKTAEQQSFHAKEKQSPVAGVAQEHIDRILHELKTTLDAHAVIGQRCGASGHFVARIAQFYLDAKFRRERQDKMTALRFQQMRGAVVPEEQIVHELKTTLDTAVVIGARLKVPASYVSFVGRKYLDEQFRRERRSKLGTLRHERERQARALSD